MRNLKDMDSRTLNDGVSAGIDFIKLAESEGRSVDAEFARGIILMVIGELEIRSGNAGN